MGRGLVPALVTTTNFHGDEPRPCPFTLLERTRVTKFGNAAARPRLRPKTHAALPPCGGKCGRAPVRPGSVRNPVVRPAASGLLRWRRNQPAGPSLSRA